MFNIVEKYETDYKILDTLNPIGNCLGFFVMNMLGGGNCSKAQVIAESLSKDIKFIFLTEAETKNINESYEPILKNFETFSFLTPCDQKPNEAIKATGHLVLINGPNVKGLSF